MLLVRLALLGKYADSIPMSFIPSIDLDERLYHYGCMYSEQHIASASATPVERRGNHLGTALPAMRALSHFVAICLNPYTNWYQFHSNSVTFSKALSYEK